MQSIKRQTKTAKSRLKVYGYNLIFLKRINISAYQEQSLHQKERKAQEAITHLVVSSAGWIVLYNILVVNHAKAVEVG